MRSAQLRRRVLRPWGAPCGVALVSKRSYTVEYPYERKVGAGEESDYHGKTPYHHRATAADLMGEGANPGNDDSPWGPGSAGYEWKKRWLSERRAAAMEYQFNPNRRQPITDAARQRSRLNEARLKEPLVPRPGEGETATEVLLQSMFGDAEAEADAAAEAAARRYLDAVAARRGAHRPRLGDDGAPATGTDELDAERVGAASAKSATYVVPQRSKMPVNGDVTAEELDFMSEYGHDTLAHLSYRDVEALADELYGGAAAAASAQSDEMLRKWAGLRRATGQLSPLGSVPQAYRLEWTPWYLTNLPR